MAEFERLHPHLRHAIVHELGWRELRPVQELTIGAVLDGANTVVLAPTAGGKTEASLFPVLSTILSDAPPPVAALYLCPIRALLNNLEERAQRYARMVGLSAFKWHGDVSDSAKSAFRRDPGHLLLTTPESLEVMMISARTDARALFGGLRMVVIDEVHAFAGDDRGAHLAALLERLTELVGRDLQRIGLSATIGNPGTIGEWMTGSSRRPFRLVDPPRGPPARELAIELTPDLDDVARGIADRARGKKSLVFVDSRAKAERVAHALEGRGVEVFVHHSAVSRADRAQAEEAFARGDEVALVSTSTMELGIDVGDLDQVLQVDAPPSVASFLQRIGRTGRRSGTTANCTFLAMTPEAMLQAAAIVRLAADGWVEDVRPSARALHILAHQIMALSLQEDGVSRHRLMRWVEAAFPFLGLGDARVRELIDTMVSREILYEADGLLSLGSGGERLYGRKNFFELYGVFSAPPVLRVLHGRDEVGQLAAGFVQAHDQSRGPLCFRLAGRPWRAVRIDWNKGVVHVEPAERGSFPNWLGTPGALSRELCQAIMFVLVDGVVPAKLGDAARATLDAQRSSYAGLLEPGTAPLEDTGDAIIWHTFAGGRINRLLAHALEARTGGRWVPGNLSVRAKSLGLVAARDAVRSLVGVDWSALAIGSARSMARGLVSKFQPCLPADAEDHLLGAGARDVEGTIHFVRRVTVDGRSPGGPARLADPELAAPLAPRPVGGGVRRGAGARRGAPTRSSPRPSRRGRWWRACGAARGRSGTSMSLSR